MDERDKQHQQLNDPETLVLNWRQPPSPSDCGAEAGTFHIPSAAVRLGVTAQGRGVELLRRQSEDDRRAKTGEVSSRHEGCEGDSLLAPPPGGQRLAAQHVVSTEPLAQAAAEL